MNNTYPNLRTSRNILPVICFVISLIGSVFVTSTAAQQRDPNRGFRVSTAYAGGDFDAVNVNNGNLIVNIPLASLPAANGPDFPVTLQYNSKLWDSKETVHSSRLQQGNGDQNPDDGNSYYYVTNHLQQSAHGGWKIVAGHQLIETNRNALADPDPCNGSATTDDYNARWKLEMVFPDGEIRQFIPAYGSSIKTKDGYYNVNANGESFNYNTQTNPANGLCYIAGSTNGGSVTGMTYITTDGSRMRLFVPYSSTNVSLDARNWKLYQPDGTFVEHLPPDDLAVAHRITDRNGNKIEVMMQGGIRDQFGRSITFGDNTVTVKGVDGESLTTQIVYGSKWVRKRYATIGYDQTFPYGVENHEEINTSVLTVEQVVMPQQAGGQSYLFEYNGNSQEGGSYSDGWGELKSVTLPSGAKAVYTYQYPYDSTGEYTTAAEVLENQVTQRDMTYLEEYGGVQTPRTETTYYSNSVLDSVVTLPNGASTQSFQVYYTNFRQWDSGLIYRTNNPDLSISEKLWAYNLPQYTNNSFPYAYMRPGNANAYVKTEFTTITDANFQPWLTAIKDYTYDKNGNLLEIREYDWVPYSSVPRNNLKVTGLPSSGLVLKRKTVNTYYNQAPTADSTQSSPVTYENPNSPKLKNVIKSSETQDGSGIVKSRSEFFYDDPNNRGNLIETRVWDSTKGVLNSPDANGNRLSTANSVLTKTEYDTYGNPTLMTDANNNKTLIAYGDISGPNGIVSNLYPTEVTTAYNTPIQQTVRTEYDFYTGAPTKVTALGNTTNENVLSETEYDALGRPTKVKSPVGKPEESWTRTEYDDINRQIITRSDVETKGDGKKVSTQFLDQLGRVRLTKMLEDPATQSPTNETDGIKVETRYLMDNPYSYVFTSNPYRAANSTAATNEAEMGWTVSKTHYTGKFAEAETFSGAALPTPLGENSNSTGKVKTDAEGDKVMVTDQTGKRRISKTNVLGQLINVWEVTAADSATEAITFSGSSLNAYKTSYSYDTLNNLTTVNQGVQTRSFSYSSLSRLLSANNPESGLISYIYDNNGNLTTKTDARQVVTSYAYDALNRVTNRNYSTPNGTPPNYEAAPNVTYTYDNLPYAKGRLIAVDNGTSKTEYTEFDILGRVKKSRQTTDGTAYPELTYNYNLSGALVEQKYPSGRVVKNVLDNDGDLSIVQSSKNQASGFFNYAKNFSYTAAGAVSSMQLGNGRWESTQFNSRLQPTQIALGTTQNATDKLKLDFTYNTPGQNDNNGNVLSQTITVPTETRNGQTFSGFTATQTYTYDALNRIKDAKEMTGATQQWRQTFQYDRYGNRTFDTGTDAGGSKTTTIPQGCAAQVCNPQVDPNTNKLVGYQFDEAGNTKTDAQNRKFTYDGENKQTKVETVDAGGNPVATVGQYYYDGDGKRVKKVSATETTIFIYDASGRMVAEYSTQVETTNAKVSYLTSDHLGSPRINTDQTGAVTARHDYQPFGEEIQRASYGADAVRKQFTSYERDNETDLDFAEARMYSNKLGRFTTVDPMLASAKTILPESWNRYTYCYNNPLVLIDPDGMEVEFLDNKAIDGALSTLPESLRKKVKDQIKDGFLKKKSLDKIKSTDANFLDLKKLVNDDKTLEVMTSNKDPLETTKDFFYKSREEEAKEVYEGMIKAGATEEEAKEEANKVEEPNYKTQSLKGGVTLTPKQSGTGNWRVVLPDFTGDASDFPVAERAASAAHELYGHALPGMQGKPWLHDVKNGVQNPNGPVNTKHRQIEMRTRNLYKTRPTP